MAFLHPAGIAVNSEAFVYPADTTIEFGILDDGLRKSHSIRHFKMKPFSSDKDHNINAEFHFPKNAMVKDLKSPVRMAGVGLQRSCDVLVYGENSKVLRRVKPGEFEAFLIEKLGKKRFLNSPDGKDKSNDLHPLRRNYTPFLVGAGIIFIASAFLLCLRRYSGRPRRVSPDRS